MAKRRELTDIMGGVHETPPPPPEGKLIPFSVRLPESEYAALKAAFWANGEKMAAGARRVLMEWLRRQR